MTLSKNSFAYFLLGLDVGPSLLTYDEIFQTDSTLNKEITENAVSVNFHTQLGLLTRWAYVKANIQYLGLPFGFKDKSFSQLNQAASISLVLPSRPINVTLVAEQFFTQMYPSDSSFGYTKLQGIHFFPYADYTTQGGITFFIKYPLFTFLTQRKELKAGMHFRFGNQGGRYPEIMYQEAYVLKAEYTKVTLEFEGEIGSAVAETQEILVSLGYIF